MFQLPGADLTPTKAIFVPLFSTLGEMLTTYLQETFPGIDSQLIVSPVSLGSNDLKFTPVKRKLDEAFIATQHGFSTIGSKKDVVEDEVDIVSVWDFVKVFNGKKWDKFNSEKVASIAYAAYKGKQPSFLTSKIQA